MNRTLVAIAAAMALALVACSNEAKDVFAPDQKALTEKIESGQLTGDALASAYLQRAFLWYLIGDHAKTIDDCTQAVGAAPKMIDSYELRAEAYRRMGRLDEALADASQAVSLAAPTDSTPYLLRAKVLEDHHDYAKAAADYDEALKRNPDTWEAYVYRGAAFAEAGEGDRAIADLGHAIATDPGMIHKSSFRSCTRFQGQTTPNCTSQDVGTSTADLVQKAYFTRGLVLFRKAEYQRSTGDFRHAGTSEAMVYWGLADLALGNCQEGYSEIRRAYNNYYPSVEKALADHHDFIAKTACPEE